jgi:hypothetical protein
MSNVCYVTLPAAGTVIAATVTAIVYTTLSTTGEIAAAAAGTGIELTGSVLALGTDYIAGTLAGNTVRNMAKTYGAVTRPAISQGSKLGALGLSVLAGTVAAVTTTAVVNSGSYLYSCYEEYKQKNMPQEAIKFDYSQEESGDIINISSPEYNNSLIKSP